MGKYRTAKKTWLSSTKRTAIPTRILHQKAIKKNVTWKIDTVECTQENYEQWGTRFSFDKNEQESLREESRGLFRIETKSEMIEFPQAI